MIQANELRIGNILTHKGELSNIGHIQNNFYGVQINGVGEMGFDQFEPIHLTPEILEKCGFQNVQFGENDNCYILPYSRRSTNDEVPLHDMVLVDFGIVDKNYSGRFSFAIREKDRDIQFGITNIDFVHQLQNVYFALTGKEIYASK